MSVASTELLLTLAGKSALLEHGVRQPMTLAIFDSNVTPHREDLIDVYSLIPGSLHAVDSAAWVLSEETGTVVATYPMESWRFPLWTGVARGAVLLGEAGQLFGASRFPSTGYRIDHAGDVIVLMPSISW